MTLTRIETTEAPAAIGPYSQGIRAGEFLFTAGQIALDPATGQLIDGGIEDQTKRVLRNLTAILESAGTTWSQVVKTTVYLQDLGHFPTVNEIYSRWIGESRPARSTVEVAALPRGALVEIDAIAHVK